ncbi:MAG: hypothetical protein CMJ78_01550 [Planctomycetaceae bacterium]|nr:hypothetical protein [Planctomycetaceae bacterium]
MYQSQTACYAKDRRNAIHKLGDNYNCVCNPEIMVAFVYALNDADERVRAKAADEIGDQIRENNGCCCTKTVIAGLKAALGDCDKAVRHQAEEALEACGFEVVDADCKSCKGGCTDDACDHCAPKAKSEKKEAAPPAPKTSDPKAYFPSRLLKQVKKSRKSEKKVEEKKDDAAKPKSLANLFGLIN